VSSDDLCFRYQREASKIPHVIMEAQIWITESTFVGQSCWLDGWLLELGSVRLMKIAYCRLFSSTYVGN